MNKKFDPYVKGSVRRSQVITTYGVGAIVAAADESFMVVGIDHWQVNENDLDVHEPRLEQQLHVRGFNKPPSDDGRDIPVVRFPETYYCPQCNRLQKHSYFGAMLKDTCPQCGVGLVPSRFVMACNNGHIDDFPYFRWVHAGIYERGRQHELRIESGGASASLSDIVISCSCGASKTMQGAFGRYALRGISKCTGHRPWLGDTEECDEQPRTLQRGASNVWFPVVYSSISIPPWSEGAFKLLNRHWEILRHINDDTTLLGIISGTGIAEKSGYTAEDLLTAVKERKRREEMPTGDEDGGFQLRTEEYEALIRGMPERSGDQDFVCIPVSDVAPEVAAWFDRVSQVKRLREVRALRSFTRLNPPSPADERRRRAPLSFTANRPWLPAIEVLGEGIFLRLEERRLGAWEGREDVMGRAAVIDAEYTGRFAGLDAEPDRRITPRLLLIHTLAHALINQFALASGYPAAALRERLYVSKEMAGLLIYTATTDSAGSLGGVVAQAKRERLRDTFLEALARASWCSADPLCIESDPGGVDNLNYAACHACVLLPEVSCEEANLLLDRGLLVGTSAIPDLGYFSSLA